MGDLWEIYRRSREDLVHGGDATRFCEVHRWHVQRRLVPLAAELALGSVRHLILGTSAAGEAGQHPTRRPAAVPTCTKRAPLDKYSADLLVEEGTSDIVQRGSRRLHNKVSVRMDTHSASTA